MDIYGERYADVRLFINYCRELNVKTDERELAYYERTGVMLPVARVIYPEHYVVEVHRRESDGDYNWNGIAEYPELGEITEKFPSFLRTFNDITDEELTHCFDRAAYAGGNPYLCVPTLENFKPWGEYAVPVPDDDYLKLPTATHYYSYWQVHQLYLAQQHPHLHRYAALVDRLPQDDPARTSWLNFPSKESLREFHGMRARFDALSFWITLYGRERARTFAGVPEANGALQIDADAADAHKKRLARLASTTMDRFGMADSDLYRFMHQLIHLYEDYQRNERYKLARKLRFDILHCGRLLELSGDQEWEQVAERLGELNQFDKRTFRHLLAAAKERDYAVDLLTHAPSTLSGALETDGKSGWPFTETDANSLLDFCEKQELSLLRTSLSGMLAIGQDELLEKFGRNQTYTNLKNILTGYESFLRTIALKAVSGDLPTDFTMVVSKVMHERGWAKKFDRVRSEPRRLLHASSSDQFRSNLNTLLSHKELQGSSDGLCAMAFLVTCLGRNFTAHSLPDNDEAFHDVFGKTLDAVIIAITYTWLLAGQKGWIELHSTD